MPLFTKHREKIYDRAGLGIAADLFSTGEKVTGYSNPKGKANRQALVFEVTEGPQGNKRFTLKGRFG